MTDPRVVKLARVLVKYSLEIKKGDLFLIRGGELAAPLIREVYREALKAGAYAYTRVSIDGLEEIYYKTASNAQLEYISEITKLETKKLTATLAIISDTNTRALSNVDPAKQAIAQKARKTLNKRFLDRAAKGELRWSATLYPTQARAQEAEMSLEEYEDFVYRACLLDADDPIAEWKRISNSQKGIVKFLNRVGKIEVTGPDTELTLSVQGRKWINCDGHENFPDGEIFTSPVEDSVSGHVRFSFPACGYGREVEDVRLWFERGKVVRATAAKNQEFLLKMLDMDEGSRFLGEFSVANNYGIQRYTKEILFDEKIGGTIHMALGASYPETGGKNVSGLHWDMVCDLRQGGELRADGKTFYRDGKWLKTLG